MLLKTLGKRKTESEYKRYIARVRQSDAQQSKSNLSSHIL